MPEVNFPVFKMRLHAVSPIHIGCDRVYEPTEFVIPDDQDVLIAFDSLRFVQALDLPAKKRFEDICLGGTLLEIYKFIRGNASKIDGRKVPISPDLARHYREVLGRSASDLSQIINQFTLCRTAFLAYDGRPFIPGSSLKGSLRTAYLNHLAANSERREERKGVFLEERLLGGTFAADPFSLLKISDLSPVETLTSIGYALNRKKEVNGNVEFHAGNGPYQILETIHPGSVFEGTLKLSPPCQGSPVRSPIVFKRLFEEAVNSFYQKCLQEEVEVIGDLLDRTNSPLFDKFSKGKEAHLVRLGRHSGAESVTIEGYRNIFIKQGRGGNRFEGHSTTLWLSSRNLKNPDPTSCYPFGWAILELAHEPGDFVPIAPPKMIFRPSTIGAGKPAQSTGFSRTIPPPPPPKTQGKTPQPGMEREGTLRRVGPDWTVEFPGSDWPVTLVAQVKIPPGTVEGSQGVFYILEAKKSGIKARFERIPKKK